MKTLLFIALCVFGTTGWNAAQAADLQVQVQDSAGAPLPWAVVSLNPEAEQGIGNWQPAPAIMMQQGILFAPFVLSTRQGTTVSFPNLDDVRHHVYSFSRPKKFELRLYGRDETKTVVFDKAGPVALGCNIHDNMLSYVYVTEDPVHAVTDSLGQITFVGLPAGPWQARVWHPDLKGEKNAPQPLVLDEDALQKANFTVDLRSVRRQQLPLGQGSYQ